MFTQYFGSAAAAQPDDVESDLWNANVDETKYSSSLEKYQGAILEQYKLYVEMADRISVRRGLANTFFLTLHVAIFTLFGVLWKDPPQANLAWLALPYVILSGLCLAWFWLVRSYRQLNSGKYAVIGAFERRLPASPYWAAEWKALGGGIDKSRYWPLTHLEKWLPLLFFIAYTGAFVVAFLA